uniref:Uncharacterized protein n=1 Tax=Branchiostoma floridae TaxID=7739 RepID=C3YK74_BRAFL|eukprot:XP_002603520.1 hypothetical protein BRAFLDRAFT_79055 [Branchiostoma floridae]
MMQQSNTPTQATSGVVMSLEPPSIQTQSLVVNVDHKPGTDTTLHEDVYGNDDGVSEGVYENDDDVAKDVYENDDGVSEGVYENDDNVAKDYEDDDDLSEDVYKNDEDVYENDDNVVEDVYENNDDVVAEGVYENDDDVAEDVYENDDDVAEDVYENNDDVPENVYENNDVDDDQHEYLDLNEPTESTNPPPVATDGEPAPQGPMCPSRACAQLVCAVITASATVAIILAGIFIAEPLESRPHTRLYPTTQIRNIEGDLLVLIAFGDLRVPSLEIGTRRRSTPARTVDPENYAASSVSSFRVVPFSTLPDIFLPTKMMQQSNTPTQATSGVVTSLEPPSIQTQSLFVNVDHKPGTDTTVHEDVYGNDDGVSEGLYENDDDVAEDVYENDDDVAKDVYENDDGVSEGVYENDDNVAKDYEDDDDLSEDVYKNDEDVYENDDNVVEDVYENNDDVVAEGVYENDDDVAEDVYENDDDVAEDVYENNDDVPENVYENNDVDDDQHEYLDLNEPTESTNPPPGTKKDAGKRHVITFGGRGSTPGKFARISGVVVSASNEILVVEYDNCRVQAFNMNGVYIRHFLTTVPGKPGRNMNPDDISIDGNDNLWVVGKLVSVGSYAVQYNRDGQALAKFRVPNSSTSLAIAVDVQSDYILVANFDTSSCKIFIYQANGKIVRNLQLDISCSSFIAINRDGAIFTLENNIVHVFNQRGHLLFKFADVYVNDDVPEDAYEDNDNVAVAVYDNDDDVAVDVFENDDDVHEDAYENHYVDDDVPEDAYVNDDDVHEDAYENDDDVAVAVYENDDDVAVDVFVNDDDAPEDAYENDDVPEDAYENDNDMAGDAYENDDMAVDLYENDNIDNDEHVNQDLDEPTGKGKPPTVENDEVVAEDVYENDEVLAKNVYENDDDVAEDVYENDKGVAEDVYENDNEDDDDEHVYQDLDEPVESANPPPDKGPAPHGPIRPSRTCAQLVCAVITASATVAMILSGIFIAGPLESRPHPTSTTRHIKELELLPTEESSQTEIKRVSTTTTLDKDLHTSTNIERTTEDGGKRHVITFGGRGTTLGKFARLSGVVVSSRNEIFVADEDNNRVQLFNMKGVYIRHFLTTVPGKARSAIKPASLSIDGHDNLWVVGNVKFFSYVPKAKATGETPKRWRDQIAKDIGQSIKFAESSAKDRATWRLLTRGQLLA